MAGQKFLKQEGLWVYGTSFQQGPRVEHLVGDYGVNPIPSRKMGIWG